MKVYLKENEKVAVNEDIITIQTEGYYNLTETTLELIETFENNPHPIHYQQKTIDNLKDEEYFNSII